MSNQIFIGETTHQRVHPIKHSFSYPLYMMDLDISDVKTSEYSSLFSVDAFNLFSLQSKDYLYPSTNNIRDKFDTLLNRFNEQIDYDELRLLTTPRLLKKSFNPVSFYFAYKQEELTFILAEVTNTFKEKHIYFFNCITAKKKKGYYYFKKAKEFYISPFSKDDGDLELYICDIKKSLDIVIVYKRDNQREVIATLKGQHEALTAQSLIKVALKYPLTAAKTMPRILWQAFKIHYLKKHKARRKPMATVQSTIVKETPTLINSAYVGKFKKLLRSLKGSIKVSYPNGDTEIYGQDNNPNLKLEIRTYNFFDRIVQSTDIGLAESYIQGEWNTNNLTGFYRYLIKNMNTINRNYRGKNLIKKLHNIRHRLRHNSIENSSKNISEHYDLGNDFYKLFLDKSMSYSCAYFKKPSQSLEQAQNEKINRIIQDLKIEPHHHVLEIGTGWGSLAIKMAKQSGCKVTSITLSKEQYTYASQRVSEEGLDKQIKIMYQDYRDHSKKYDRIVSIEMIEAVGHDYLNDYIQQLNKNLKDDGLVFIQSIMIADQHYESYRQKTDFIQQYIFPGGHLPSLNYLSNLLNKNSSFMIENATNIGQHYARTLHEWQKRFRTHKATVIDTHDSNFYRLWDLYLSYSEAAFAERYIHTYQLLLSKAQNRYLIDTFEQGFKND